MEADVVEDREAGRGEVTRNESLHRNGNSGMASVHSMSFGMAETDLDQAAADLAQVLNVTWTARESIQHGGSYYSAQGIDKESFELLRNYNAMDDDWFELDFKHCPVVFHVEITERPDLLIEILTSLGTIELIDSIEWDY